MKDNISSDPLLKRDFRFSSEGMIGAVSSLWGGHFSHDYRTDI